MYNYTWERKRRSKKTMHGLSIRERMKITWMVFPRVSNSLTKLHPNEEIKTDDVEIYYKLSNPSHCVATLCVLNFKVRNVSRSKRDRALAALKLCGKIVGFFFLFGWWTNDQQHNKRTPWGPRKRADQPASIIIYQFTLYIHLRSKFQTIHNIKNKNEEREEANGNSEERKI